MTNYISNQLGNHLAYLIISSHCVSSVPSKYRRYCPVSDFLADQADALSEFYRNKLFSPPQGVVLRADMMTYVLSQL